ncbi:glycosyl hydrolase [Aestuariibacter sp. A3R04]|uniref:glycosyl hydrolase n=1 Tax=Aestuariibacter sp. A3R04 TaxID=2841571 RepID=UPI001C085224|nr:glycosyl hydrolase [Aestuariibacter sp. A3R04]MBU3020424.1 glycoside hydrolase [Aestuariibacter sp. A3R04]
MNQSQFAEMFHSVADVVCKMSLVVFLFGSLVNADTLSEQAFKNPEKTFLPKTWMHAMNGNLSKDGFTEDFRALGDAGIGGAIFFHVHRRNVPYSSNGPIRFGTEEFYDHLVHAAAQADKNNIEFGIHNSDGWTSSGGPWITPELSMKRITWSEVAVSGGRNLTPPQPGYAEGFYRDVAVIALPINKFNANNAFANAKLSASDSALNVAALSDSDWDTELEFVKNKNDEYWVQIELETAASLRSLQIETPNRHGDASLQVSDDGINFTTVVDKLRRPRTGARMWAFSPQLVSKEQDGFRAKYFRIVFTKPIAIKRFDLWSIPRIDNWLSMNAMERGRLSMTPSLAPEAMTSVNDVVVLNRGDLPQDGVQVPSGNWRILRFGYTSTGAFNVPATVEGEGLEVDKFDPSALRYHFEQYVGKLVKKVQEEGIQSLKTTEIDSYEVGGQNWTQNIDKSFEAKFGYDLIPWLPLLTGRIIESAEHTGAILQDFRQHLSDLMVQNYFGEFTRVSNEYDLESYIEPYGWGPFDELAAGGQADRLMGEFWVREQEYNGRVMAAISSAHIYGKNIISAESFTSINTVNWYGHPYFYKHYGDEMWARGINETMFHRFAHQPNNFVKPGMTMDSIGSHIDRTQTWWGNGGKAWFKYLARGSYLLQQGVPDADFLVHLGDMAPLRVGNANNTSVPAGFGYDYTNTEVLINRVKVEDGYLVLPEGTRYRALHLYKTGYMHLKTLQRIKELVAQGATVIGDKPDKVIGYSEWSKQKEFDSIVEELWGEESENEKHLRRYKKGIVSSFTLQETIAQLNYAPDLVIDGKPAQFFAHRRIGKNDLYYFYNDDPFFKQVEVNLRNGNGKAEIWNIDDGSIEHITDFTRANKRLTTTLPLEPFASRFIVIRREGQTPNYVNKQSTLLRDYYVNQHKVLHEFDQPWEVYFDEEWAGPGKVTFNTLIDWKNSPLSSIKYYSGTAKYTNHFFIASSQMTDGKPLYLDLGDVQQIAEVSVNGEPVATLWKPPFVVDISGAIKAGENTLEVDVTNTWVNRLIGDEALPDTSGYSMIGDTAPWIVENRPPPKSERVTFTGFNFFEKQPKKLQSSGLIGPVKVFKVSTEMGPVLSGKF